ncbi:MAG TPA: PQQ-dependent sugar dehydrogenase [Phycisphaerales bacterium]|nr:PQQ-dependent sugar dehydrogenase [Phycisphaerales bacterium]
MTTLRSLAVAASLFAAAAAPVLAQDYANVQDIITSGLSSPVGLYACPGDDTRLFIVEQGGRIRIVNVTIDGLGNKTYALAPNPFLDLNALDAANPFFRDGGGNPLQDQTGTVIPRIVRNGGNPVISNGNTYPVNRGGEQGLLGLAFAPDYQTSRKFYIYYCMSNPAANGVIPFSLGGNGSQQNPFNATNAGNNVIFEFQRDANNASLADTSTERMVLTHPDDFTNHNGCTMFFGRDGLLYAGFGDGGSGNDPNNRALNPNQLLGKMIRINPFVDDFPADANRNYGIPAGNPYAAGGGRPEIWARGLRNPWRWSFDRWNGDMWIADVGQGLWEEINHVVGNGGAGLNYGWRVREGLISTGLSSGGHDISNLTSPVYVYPHSFSQPGTNGNYTNKQDGASVAGGIVYRGHAIRPLRGKYFFADTYASQVWAFNANVAAGAGTPAAVGLEEYSGAWRSTINNVTPPAFSNIVAFGEDNDGEMFIVQIGGRIRKLVPQGAQPPMADVGIQGGLPGADGLFDNNDFVVFIDFFFNGDPRADMGKQGGLRGVDQMLDNNDFVAFIDAFFEQE